MGKGGVTGSWGAGFTPKVPSELMLECDEFKGRETGRALPRGTVSTKARRLQG